MESKVSIDINDRIARIVIDDGKVNAMSTDLMEEIGSALDAAESAEAVVVLSGREGIFSAGFDMKTFARGTEASLEMVNAGAQLILRFLAFPQPILTVCTGHAYPMGAFLMLSADSRVGVDGPWQIGMNEVAIGITVPWFAIELARHRLAPQGLANVNIAAMFAPTDAMRLGYLDRVVKPDQLENCVDEEANRLRGLDLHSFRATKSRINQQVVDAITNAIRSKQGEIESTLAST